MPCDVCERHEGYFEKREGSKLPRPESGENKRYFRKHISTYSMLWLKTQTPEALAPEHGYVLVMLVVTWLVHNGWMASKVMAARKEHNVKYPTMYATGDSESDRRCVTRRIEISRIWKNLFSHPHD